jgi:UDP-N-acetylmuramate dehydrogenase
VSDAGIRGLVVEIGAGMSEIRIEAGSSGVGNGAGMEADDGVDENCAKTGRIIAGAGALLSRVANAAADAGLGGMEFAAGIPGSIGGAVTMNAVAYGGEMKDILESVTVLTPEGEKRTLYADALELSYRHSIIPSEGYIVLEAVLALSPRRKEEIRAQMDTLRKKRVEKQPLEYPSAGSTFKRPEGYFAGKLIMDAGLRGYAVGGAQVSEKHCGFVINRGGATAAEVRQLMCDVQDRVEERSGVRLEPEVKMIGEFE